MMENNADFSDIRVRIEMCKLCIRVLEDDCKDDPRQPSALEHYKAQLKRLEQKAAPHNFGNVIPSTQPPDIVIGLKPARLFGVVPK